ncbi:MAG: amino acid permease [Elusimicrobia bacterium]|nr:amino acid permease [Elusimicrobiota bacterium]
MNLKRELNFFDVFCLGVNSIVGSGIYLFPGLLAGALGPASITVFPVTGLLLIPVALCFAHMAARYETNGGPYLYARDAFGLWVGYAVGWSAWITSLVSIAAVANAISSYLAYFSPSFETWTGSKLTALSVVTALGILNYRGVKPAAWTANFFTVAKLIPLFLFILIGLAFLEPGNLTPFAPKGYGSMGPMLLLAFFAFQGFENVPVPSGEAKFPKRDAPRATVWSLLGSIVLYTVIQTVAVCVYPNLAGSSRPLAEAAAHIVPALATLLAAGAAISTLGYTTGASLGAPRYLYALGTSGVFPQIVSRVHPRFGTPYLAIMIHSVICLVLVLVLDFKKLVDFANIVVCLQYFVTCGAVLKLEKTKTLTGVLGMGAVLALAYQTKTPEIIGCLAVLAAGLAISLAYKKWNQPALGAP